MKKFIVLDNFVNGWIYFGKFLIHFRGNSFLAVSLSSFDAADPMNMVEQKQLDGNNWCAITENLK